MTQNDEKIVAGANWDEFIHEIVLCVDCGDGISGGICVQQMCVSRIGVPSVREAKARTPILL